MRMVDRNGEEGQRIIAAIMSPNICNTEVKKNRVERVVLRPFFMIMEYVQGIALEDVFQGVPFGLEFVKQKFGSGSSDSNDSNASNSTFHAIGLLNCRVLGKILALDVLTNNFDRLPCIWDNKGNPGNVMFRPGTFQNSKIENVVNCVIYTRL